ncbi:MAG: T9SS type A sorting domain-containing protein [Chitinophagaceae bacterium]
MNINFTKYALPLCIACFFSLGVLAQPINQHADPVATGIVWSASTLPLGSTGTVSFVLGNAGTDMLPAEKVEWTINIPLGRVSVGQPSFMAPDGTSNTGLYEYHRVVSGTTLVIVLRSHTDIAATSDLAPQDKYKAVYPVTATTMGSAEYATINAAVATGRLSQVGNASSSNDNASALILVTGAQNLNLLYPNPANDVLNINLTAIPGVTKTNAIIYDGVGHAILTQVLQAGLNQIDVSRLASGTYTVVLDSLNQAYKVVVAR